MFDAAQREAPQRGENPAMKNGIPVATMVLAAIAAAPARATTYTGAHSVLKPSYSESHIGVQPAACSFTSPANLRRQARSGAPPADDRASYCCKARAGSDAAIASATAPRRCTPDANILRSGKSRGKGMGLVSMRERDELVNGRVKFPDAVEMTANSGLAARSTPEPGRLLLAGTAPIGIGVALKKTRTRAQAFFCFQRSSMASWSSEIFLRRLRSF
jgi:hypothetical protein